MIGGFLKCLVKYKIVIWLSGNAVVSIVLKLYQFL